MAVLRKPIDRKLWLLTVASIVAIVVAGSLVARSLPGHAPSPIWERLVAAAIVTVIVAVAKLTAGPRAAALAGVLGALAAVVVLIALG